MYSHTSQNLNICVGDFLCLEKLPQINTKCILLLFTDPEITLGKLLYYEIVT